MKNPELSAMEYERIRRLIEEKCGISLGDDKAYLIESRLSGLLAEYGMAGFEELYLKLMQSGGGSMVEKLVDAVVTNETFWFRDKSPWVILDEVLLPAYLREIEEGKRSKVRIWSAACSSGQEPYSIAMCIDRHLKKRGRGDLSLSRFEILATDISSAIIQFALAGRYDSLSISRGLGEEYRNAYFTNTGRVWKISDGIREAVRFMQFNLQDDFSRLGTFDVIFIRNVLIYFSDRLKRNVIEKTASVLGKGGVLFIGNSEIFGNAGEFCAEQYKDGIYYRVKK